MVYFEFLCSTEFRLTGPKWSKQDHVVGVSKLQNIEKGFNLNLQKKETRCFKHFNSRITIFEEWHVITMVKLVIFKYLAKCKHVI